MVLRLLQNRAVEDLTDFLRKMLLQFDLGAVTILVLVILIFALNRARPSSRNIPQGPPTIPLIGNLHQIPKTGAHKKFTEWSKQFGGLFTLRFGNANAAVITDRRLIKSLVDKKSAIYSNRPPSYVSHSLITRGDHLLVMNHGSTWRSFRKIIHQHFMETMCEQKHIVLQDAEAVQMLRDFCLFPGQHMLHPKRFSNSIIMSIVFGIRTQTYNTPHMTSLYDIMEKWSQVMETGATPPVDVYPFLKYIPERFFGNWRSRAKDVGKRMDALYGSLVDRVSNRHQQEQDKESFIDSVLQKQEKLNLTRNQINFLGGVLMEGGSDTTSTMLLVFIQAMIKWKDIQKRAQTEIDSVISENRSPQWSDYSRLPFICMIIKEVMRWRPVTPLSFPHCLAEDDWIDGKLLQKGTIIIMNVWGLHHDESVFPNPDIFDPERYAGRTQLAAEYAASSDYEKRDHYGYGSGRRICPGIHLAERNLFLGVAKLLWAFSFEPNIDAQGREIPVDTDSDTGYTEGFLVSPKTFDCRIRPRSEARRETIMREFCDAETKVFSKYEV